MTAQLTLHFDRSGLGDPVLNAAASRPPALEAPGELAPQVLALARATWVDRTRSEYVGVMIVRKLHGLLVDLNAPRDLQELALRMLLDEQRHAGACAAVVEALGGEPAVVFDLAELQQARDGASLEQQLLTMLVGTYALGEVVAHALLRHAIRALPASGYRDVLRGIARDEVLHARFGGAVLAAARKGRTADWLPWPGDPVVADVAARQVAWMAQRDVVERHPAFGDPAHAAALARLGVPAPAPFHAAYHRALARARAALP